MIHCVRVGDNSHLYVYGDHICYTWWQYLIIVVLLPMIFLFPLTFGTSFDLLNDRVISTNTFLLSCAMPFATLWLCIKRRFGRLQRNAYYDREEESCVEEILNDEERLFRVETKGIRWSSVQLYRNLFIVLLDTFILNAIYKSIIFLLVFGGFYIHDRDQQPFKHPYLNILQRLTSACLFVVTVCSVPSSFSSLGDVMAIPNIEILLLILRYVELLLYIIVPSSLIIWKVWEWRECRLEKYKKEK